MEKRQLPILIVVKVGSVFGRFLIQDQNEKIWTGEQFGSGCGALYADHDYACVDVHSILKRHFAGTEPRRYVVPCFIEVFSHEPVREMEVARYLPHASRLILDTTEHGNGPGNSLVLPVIDWKRIEPLKQFPND